MTENVLHDQFQRRITYLRMSVTDRCNYRCTYCMPEEGLKALGRYELLTFEELVTIARVFVREGIQKIRITGGEPLLRRDLHLLLQKISALPGLHDLCLTTNGHLLEERVEQLAQAGLQRINVSLDSLQPEKFKSITRGGDLHKVLRGLEKAAQVMPGRVKLNVVVSHRFNDDEVLDFARVTIDPGYTVRFIEQMPMSAMAPWERGEVLSVVEIRQQIEQTFGLEPVHENGVLSGPASRFRLPGAKGEIGFIGAVTDEFCARCNRIRLTPDGRLRGCLMADGELDLKEAIRTGHDPEESVRNVLHQVLRTKPDRHYINETYFIRPLRTMSQIGG